MLPYGGLGKTLISKLPSASIKPVRNQGETSFGNFDCKTVPIIFLSSKKILGCGACGAVQLALAKG
jgi:hypothetical protein